MYDSTHRAWQDSPSGSYRAWQDSPVAHDLRGSCSEKGPSLARCSPGVSFSGALRGILNTWGAYLAKASSSWMHGGDILPRKGVFPVWGSFGNASGRYYARNAAFRVIRVRFEGVSFEGCAFACPKWASKMFRPGMRPLACSGTRFEDASSRTRRLHR